MPRNHIRYRNNGIISGLRWNGPKRYDGYTAGPTYENLLVADDYGVLVDSRRPSAGDIDQKEGASPAIGVSPYYPPGGES